MYSQTFLSDEIKTVRSKLTLSAKIPRNLFKRRVLYRQCLITESDNETRKGTSVTLRHVLWHKIKYIVKAGLIKASGMRSSKPNFHSEGYQNNLTIVRT